MRALGEFARVFEARFTDSSVNFSPVPRCIAEWFARQDGDTPKSALLGVSPSSGACIHPQIALYFSEKLLALAVMKVIDFSEDELVGGKRRAHDGLRDWQSVGEGLGRLATGLGGASIALGFEPDEYCRKYVPRGPEL